MSQKDGCNNDMGWWSQSDDSDVDWVDPPYLTAAPGQIGAPIDRYESSLMGFASDQFPNGEECPDAIYVWRSNTSGEAKAS
jgi:hypothetical protein